DKLLFPDKERQDLSLFSVTDLQSNIIQEPRVPQGHEIALQGVLIVDIALVRENPGAQSVGRNASVAPEDDVFDDRLLGSLRLRRLWACGFSFRASRSHGRRFELQLLSATLLRRPRRGCGRLLGGSRRLLLGRCCRGFGRVLQAQCPRLCFRSLLGRLLGLLGRGLGRSLRSVGCVWLRASGGCVRPQSRGSKEREKCSEEQ